MNLQRRVGAPSIGLFAVAVAACDGGGPGTIVPVASTVTISLTGLSALDSATEGRWEAWTSSGGGALQPLGRLDPALAATTFQRSIDPAATVLVTWEPPNDRDALPSAYRVLTGQLARGAADLTVAGAVIAAGLTLRERPGQFTMFSPSDNDVRGYPSLEESGVWLFNMAPRDTPQGDMWVRLTPLQPGWLYEGWMVRDLGAPNAIWLSYGKFVPDASGTVNARDDTGWGPFSGALDFATAGEEEFPGDDWIANPLGLQFPTGLTLPLNLRERTPQGALRWTHLITIEPAADRGEAVGRERPFAVRPYRDLFGDAGPGIQRTITFRAEGVPTGRVAVR